MLHTHIRGRHRVECTVQSPTCSCVFTVFHRLILVSVACCRKFRNVASLMPIGVKVRLICDSTPVAAYFHLSVSRPIFIIALGNILSCCIANRLHLPVVIVFEGEQLMRIPYSTPFGLRAVPFLDTESVAHT